MHEPRPRIVFLDAGTYGDVSLQHFTELWDCTIYQVTNTAETIERLAGHVVAVTNKVEIDQAALTAPQAQYLKLIVVAATGTDIIDRDAAKKAGVKVCNVPGYATQSVAQFTMALILEMATCAMRYAAAAQSGAWQKSPVFALLHLPALELAGKKLGVIGYGNIGRAVAKMARAFGMEILVAARPDENEKAPRARIPLEQVFRQADIITLHCPTTPHTRNLINERRLSLMKPSAFLINTARGALVDEAALIKALREKRLAGAALDVISHEPPPPDHPIMRAGRELENLWVTPHTAWSALEARQRLLIEVAKNIKGFFAGKPRNLVT